MIMRKTVLIHTRHAWRSHRTQAAFNGSHGLQVHTIEQLAARLAGGFLQPIDPDDLNNAIADATSCRLPIYYQKYPAHIFRMI